MSERIFTVNYYPAAQKKFEQELQNDNLNRAYQILEDMLPAHTPDEQIKRTAVLFQGYRALVNRAKKMIDPSFTEILMV